MEQLKCPNCGGQIIKDKDDIYFCPYCGVGIAPLEKKIKLDVNVTKNEKKKIEIVRKHKNMAKTLDSLSNVLVLTLPILLIILIVLGTIFDW